jgi:hypothetical protein
MYSQTPTFRMYHHVAWYKSIEVEEEHTASIFRVKSMPCNKHKPSSKLSSLLPDFLLNLFFNHEDGGNISL